MNPRMQLQCALCYPLSSPMLQASRASTKPREHVEEGYSVEAPSCRGSSQWINRHVDNKSGFGGEDDNNTGEVEERDGEEVLNVTCSKG